ncbi:MAG: membrane-spanning protein [Clostridiales bacterium]|nr:membrane-spanning protein [Clostridiales bacterium]
MKDFIFLLLTLAVGSLFGVAATKLKIPAGLMVGAIVGVAIFNIFFEVAYMPGQTTLLVQIIAGAFIGCSMEKSDLRRLPKIIKPAAIMLGALLILNLSAGFLIYLLSPLDMVTSLMSVVPGGVSDTPIIAAVMGADGPMVAVMQLVRQVLGIGVFPALIVVYDNKRKRSDFEGERDAYTEKRQQSKVKSWQVFLCTMAVAAAFGLLGKISGITAGTFVFSIIAVLVLKLVFDFAHIPKWLKKFAQILSGSYLGSTIVMSDVIAMRYLFVPMVIIVLGYMANCFVTGKIISKTCGFSQKEAMLITTPAGASDMALISADLGVENTDIIILQVLRAVVVMSLFPQIINLLLYIVG